MRSLTINRPICAAIMLLSLCCMPTVASAAEHIVVPVVVNVVDSSDASQVEAAVARANEILDQAGISLVVVKTNQPFNVGDNDGDLTYAEGEEAQEAGRQELDNTCGAGKGLKLTIADDCWTEDPTTAGWAIHRNPTVVVEPDADPQKMGRTVAHEFCHALTLDYDKYAAEDANSIMYGYTDGGTEMTEDEIEEIRKQAKKRGWAFNLEPVFPDRPSTMPSGAERVLDVHGAVLDGCDDLVLSDGTGFIDPMFGFVDIIETSVFIPSPIEPTSTASVEIHLDGTFMPHQTLATVYEIEIDQNGDGISDGLLEAEVFNPSGIPEGFALYEDYATGNMTDVQLLIHENHAHDRGPAVLDNHSLEIIMPAEMLTGPTDIPGMPFLNAAISSYTTEIPEMGGMSLTDPPSDWFTIAVPEPGSTCCHPEITFSALPDPAMMRIQGCGLTGEFEVYIDGMPVGMSQASPAGYFAVAVPSAPSFGPGEHLVLVREIDDSAPTGAAYAVGAFTGLPPIPADITGDGMVDMQDLAELAANWLMGTGPM
ncbi:hypothetical protein STSP2_02936 [Anaerohalosphaera lusitana]|uniref:Uncharacterized protein n=1 Tax=Anaerohalosphaera lusitana TaxID=1936003 RepID=A0A1U9NQ51_9BACT|nr:hypothetical protein [Anaerohalosphaera lusitana]AQT69740.1 hypothetical protein STSP2_02936 [Anaerohalosphaera lusitana]